jgi:hypothetical protein
MKLTDQVVKTRIVLLTAAFALVGFFLEIGPVGDVFSLSNKGPTVFTGLTLECATLGFLAYLALAASAMLGLHLYEEEPMPKDEKEGEPPPAPVLPVAGMGDAAGAAVRVRPELHQLRMLLTALGGYVLLKGITLVLLWPLAQQSRLTQSNLFQLTEFGFVYTALSWFMLWQFLRWYARRRKWIRLQDELVGNDINRIIALAFFIKPAIYFVTAAWRSELSFSPLGVLTMLLNLTLVAIAAILWVARPYTLRATVIALAVTGGVIVLLTLVLGGVEMRMIG